MNRDVVEFKKELRDLLTKYNYVISFCEMDDGFCCRMSICDVKNFEEVARVFGTSIFPSDLNP